MSVVPCTREVGFYVQGFSFFLSFFVFIAKSSISSGETQLDFKALSFLLLAVPRPSLSLSFIPVVICILRV